jgi:dihydroflavonol-4-reductase
MKTLVTGGTGFLGAWMVKTLVNKGHAVSVLHRKSSDLNSLKGLPFKSLIGDVTDSKSVLEACRGQDAVFHMAGLVSYNPKDNETMEKVNVEGTRNVVEACLKNKVKRLIHSSSVVAVGASPREEILDESSEFTLQKYNFGYYESKRKAEKIILSSVKEDKLDAVILCPGVMFGAGDATKSSRKTHLKVAAGKFSFYPPGGVSVLHVEDAILAHLRALEKGKPGERYILGGENLTTKDLFIMLARQGGHSPPPIGIPSLVLKGAYALGSRLKMNTDKLLISTLFHWYSSSKAKKDLEFNPRPAEKAINESVSWARENHYI